MAIFCHRVIPSQQPIPRSHNKYIDHYLLSQAIVVKRQSACGRLPHPVSAAPPQSIGGHQRTSEVITEHRRSYNASEVVTKHRRPKYVISSLKWVARPQYGRFGVCDVNILSEFMDFITFDFKAFRHVGSTTQHLNVIDEVL